MGEEPRPNPRIPVGNQGETLPARPRSDQSTGNFITAVGGLEETLTLLDSSSDPRAAVFAGLLTDPAFSSMTAAEKRAKANLSIQDLVTIFTDVQRAKGVVAAARRIPRVLDRLGQDAEGYELECPVCAGDKQIDGVVTADDPEPVRILCPECRGLGVLRAPVDKDARKLFAEIVGLTQNSPLVAIQNNKQINYNQFGQGSTIADVLNVADDDVVEAELVE